MVRAQAADVRRREGDLPVAVISPCVAVTRMRRRGKETKNGFSLAVIECNVDECGRRTAYTSPEEVSASVCQLPHAI